MNTDASPRLLVPIPGAQAALGGLGRTTIYELAKRGDIVRVNIGRRSFITMASLEEYIDSLSASGTGADSRKTWQAPIAVKSPDAVTAYLKT